DSIAATLVDEIRADTGLRYTPIIVLRGHQDDQRRDGFSDNHFTEVLADTEHFDDVVEAVRTRSRSSPGRQVLREMRRSLVGVRERAAAQQERAEAQQTQVAAHHERALAVQTQMAAPQMAQLFERMQLARMSVLAADLSGRLLLVNDELCTLTQYSRDELLDRHVWELA